jgi:hypothetical protein
MAFEPWSDSMRVFMGLDPVGETPVWKPTTDSQRKFMGKPTTYENQKLFTTGSESQPIAPKVVPKTPILSQEENQKLFTTGQPTAATATGGNNAMVGEIYRTIMQQLLGNATGGSTQNVTGPTPYAGVVSPGQTDYQQLLQGILTKILGTRGT